MAATKVGSISIWKKASKFVSLRLYGQVNHWEQVKYNQHRYEREHMCGIVGIDIYLELLFLINGQVIRCKGTNRPSLQHP